MKGLKLLWLIMAAAVVTLGLSGISYAFHDGGVATCDSCHTMHNAQGTSAMQGNSNVIGIGKQNGTPFAGNAYLLQGSDQSSTCLNCHGTSSTATGHGAAGGYHIYTTDAASAVTPANYTPGGDFGWLQNKPSTTSAATSDRRGHNIVAVDYGLTSSPTFTAGAPGNGSQSAYPSGSLHCSSCHDPHGTFRHTTGDPKTTSDIVSSVFTSGGATKQTVASGSYGVSNATYAVGVYRLLAGKSYLPASANGVASPFINNSPIAEAPSTYNVTEGVFGTVTGVAGKGGGSAELIVAYGSGMSEWCANCHQGVFQTNAMGNAIHPAGAGATLGVATAGTTTLDVNYNKYVGSGTMTGSAQYTSLIPVENGTITTGTTSFGAIAPAVTGSSNVMCLTCHRAHASGFKNMARWDNSTELITTSTGWGAGYTPDYGYSATQTQAAYNGRPYGAFVANQRSLCNKCHAKD